MKFLLPCVLIFECCLAMPAWESIGPYGGSFRALATAPSNENIFYIVSRYHDVPFRRPACFRSTDGGDSWHQTGIISESLPVYGLAVDATDPDRLYASSYKRVHSSTDAGATWTEQVISEDTVFAVAAHPTTSSTVFAIGRTNRNDTIFASSYKSTDGGVTWDTVFLDTASSYAFCLAVAPSSPDTIYVGGRFKRMASARSRIYKSTDGGMTFTIVLDDSIKGGTKAIGVHPTNPDTVYACRLGKIIRTTDGGSSWEETSELNVYSFATSPAAPDIVYAGSLTVVHKSTDAGVTWVETGPGINGRYLYGLAVKSTDADIVYTTGERPNYDNSGFFETTNGGTSWFESNDGLTTARIPCFALAPSSQSTIYTEFYKARVYKTTNSGDDWSKTEYFPCCYILDDLIVHNAHPDTALCIEASG